VSLLRQKPHLGFPVFLGLFLFDKLLPHFQSNVCIGTIKKMFWKENYF